MATEVLGTAQAGCLLLKEVHRVNHSYVHDTTRTVSCTLKALPTSVSVSPLRALTPNWQLLPLGSYSQCPYWNPDLSACMHHNHDNDSCHWNNPTQGAVFCLVCSRCHQEWWDVPKVIVVCSKECHTLPSGHISSMPVVQMGHRHHFLRILVSTVIL